jgi:hypothetical protein
MVNFEWLDGPLNYPHGQVAPEIVRCMLRLAARYANGMRGFHRCPFCNNSAQLSTQLGDEVVYLGSAEIHVTAADTTYVAPSLLPHYVEAHEYLPPLDVLRALEDCAAQP